IGSWLAGIARNLAGVAVRRRARGHKQADCRHKDVESVRTPEDEALDREDRELLQRALARLPEAHREALVLFYLEGQSIGRIAQSLNVRDDVVKKRLSRGRRALRDSLARVEAALPRVRPQPAAPGIVVAALTTIGGRKAMAAPPSLLGKVIAIVSIHGKLSVAAIAALAIATTATWLRMHDAPDRARPPAQTNEK